MRNAAEFERLRTYMYSSVLPSGSGGTFCLLARPIPAWQQQRHNRSWQVQAKMMVKIVPATECTHTYSIVYPPSFSLTHIQRSNMSSPTSSTFSNIELRSQHCPSGLANPARDRLSRPLSSVPPQEKPCQTKADLVLASWIMMQPTHGVFLLASRAPGTHLVPDGDPC
jgi:hypothetical protein